MTIPVEQPPETMTPEVAEWVVRQLIIIAGEFDKVEAKLEDLETRVQNLESAP